MRGYRSGVADPLFNKGDWHATQQAWRQQLSQAIETMNGDELLNTSTVDLARYYASEFAFDVPILHIDDIVIDQKEAKIDVSQDRMRHISNRSRPFHVTGTTVEVELPFSGNKLGFDIQPTTYNFNNPRAQVGEGLVAFSITGTDLTSDQVKQEIDRMINSINEHLGWLTNDAKPYNASLETLATQVIESRKAKLLKDKSLVSGLGFKMKERPGESKTYAAPVVRSSIRPAVPKPVSSSIPYAPEPVLTFDDYEHILSVMENMVGVMEQSPGAFREIDEERGGSVCLNSFGRFAKWISASIMPPPSLVSAR